MLGSHLLCRTISPSSIPGGIIVRRVFAFGECSNIARRIDFMYSKLYKVSCSSTTRMSTWHSAFGPRGRIVRKEGELGMRRGGDVR